MLNIKNNSKTTLVSSISETATQMTVANASLLPDAPCRVSIDNEILEITAKEGNVCTIERGKEETTPATHAQNSEVKANITAGVIEDLSLHNIELIPKVFAGDTLRNSNDSNKGVISTEYTKAKETKITGNFIASTLRIKFKIYNGGVGTASALIYRNGVTTGYGGSNSGYPPTEYSIDVSGWVPNDLIQIWIKNSTPGGPADLTNFRIYSDNGKEHIKKFGIYELANEEDFLKTTTTPSPYPINYENTLE